MKRGCCGKVMDRGGQYPKPSDGEKIFPGWYKKARERGGGGTPNLEKRSRVGGEEVEARVLIYRRAGTTTEKVQGEGMRLKALGEKKLKRSLRWCKEGVGGRESVEEGED